MEVYVKERLDGGPHKYWLVKDCVLESSWSQCGREQLICECVSV